MFTFARRSAAAPLFLLLMLPFLLGTAHRENLTRAKQLALTLEAEFGFRAYDKTDLHSPRVLHNLLLLLRHGFPQGSLRDLKSLRSFYAYAGHDDRYDLAAYHDEERAISIGGAGAWSGPEDTDVVLLATLAHELGHAWVFGKMSSAELSYLAQHEGGWDALPPGIPLKAPAFFSPHSRPRLQGLSLTSKLATKNRHEWFADAFAAAALQRLGEKGLLGTKWREKLRGKIGKKSWVDYSRLGPRLRSWLDASLEGGVKRTLASKN